MTQNVRGFTLIEVLLALSILAIALTALLKATAENIRGTQHIKAKTISHWVAMQAIASLQSGLVPAHDNQNITKKMTFLGKTWFWNAQISSTSMPGVQKITIKTSDHADGPFINPLIGFRTEVHD
jgi:general secretion pathway protein I